MASQPSTKISMSEMNTGQRILRYLIIKKENLKRVLFFGLDVLKNTSVASPNIACKHFNLSKYGHCCKLVFPERLNGTAVNVSESYFYDMKGLFYVVFNYYNFKEQIAIVKSCFEEWSAMDITDKLPQFLKIDMEDILNEKFEPEIIGENRTICCCKCIDKQHSDFLLQDGQPALNAKEAIISDKSHISKHVLIPTLEDLNKSIFEIPGKSCSDSFSHKQGNIQPVEYTSDLNLKKNNQEMWKKLDEVMLTRSTQTSIETKDAHIQTESDIKISKPLAMSMATQTENKKRKLQTIPTVDSNSHHQSSLNLLESMSNILQEYVSKYLDDIFFFKVYSLVDSFLYLLKDELSLVISTTTGIFPFHLMLEYANIKKSNIPKNLHSNLNLYYQDGLLNLFSKWLGMQFCNFRSTISNQIGEYKKLLIQSNQFLPPALKVLNEEKLFPICMVMFLNHWLNKRLEDEEFQYSKILLVLELMNDELLTGVGHVVYAKLKSIRSM